MLRKKEGRWGKEEGKEGRERERRKEKSVCLGTIVQWLGLLFSLPKAQVQYLLGELVSHKPGYFPLLPPKVYL